MRSWTYTQVDNTHAKITDPNGTEYTGDGREMIEKLITIIKSSHGEKIETYEVEDYTYQGAIFKVIPK